MDEVAHILRNRQLPQRKSHHEKGREPINNREEILGKVAILTKTPIPRWCRYPEQSLRRAYIAYTELNHDYHIKNPLGYFMFLLKKEL